uniref:Uncharacterized protein n=1 Tax=Anguilla anguilla TaxID=7936 RepID=A0A0E9SAW5_ANGAN
MQLDSRARNRTVILLRDSLFCLVKVTHCF